MTKNKNIIKTYEFNLPYFKQGDDLGFFLEHEKTQAEAFRNHAGMMAYTFERLEKMADFLEAHPKAEIEIDADTHCIFVTGPTDLLDPLTQGEEPLLQVFEFEEDETEDEKFGQN